MFILPGLLNVKMAECLWFYTSYSFLYFPESGFYGSHLSKWQTSTRCFASLLFSRILSEAEIDTHLVSLAERDWNWTGSMPLRALFKNIDCRLRAVCPLFAVHLSCSNKAEVFEKYVFSFFFEMKHLTLYSDIMPNILPFWIVTVHHHIYLRLAADVHGNMAFAISNYMWLF